MKQAMAHDLGLLEYLAVKAGCMYLSDLHLPMYQRMLGRILRQIDENAFSIIEWNDAVQYITGVRRIFANQTEAAAYLQGYTPEMAV